MKKRKDRYRALRRQQRKSPYVLMGMDYSPECDQSVIVTVHDSSVVPSATLAFTPDPILEGLVDDLLRPTILDRMRGEVDRAIARTGIPQELLASMPRLPGRATAMETMQQMYRDNVNHRSRSTSLRWSSRELTDPSLWRVPGGESIGRVGQSGRQDVRLPPDVEWMFDQRDISYTFQRRRDGESMRISREILDSHRDPVDYIQYAIIEWCGTGQWERVLHSVYNRIRYHIATRAPSLRERFPLEYEQHELFGRLWLSYGAGTGNPSDQRLTDAAINVIIADYPPENGLEADQYRQVFNAIAQVGVSANDAADAFRAFGEALRHFVPGADNRVLHDGGVMNYAGTNTGRMSSSTPEFQELPRSSRPRIRFGSRTLRAGFASGDMVTFAGGVGTGREVDLAAEYHDANHHTEIPWRLVLTRAASRGRVGIYERTLDGARWTMHVTKETGERVYFRNNVKVADKDRCKYVTHPEAGKVVNTPRLKRSFMGEDYDDVRQPDGSVARQIRKDGA
jgi:hypothetical protein